MGRTCDIIGDSGKLIQNDPSSKRWSFGKTTARRWIKPERSGVKTPCTLPKKMFHAAIAVKQQNVIGSTEFTTARSNAAGSSMLGIEVWDLTVEGEHEFFANGVLVHNSTKSGGSFTAGALLAWDFTGKFYVEHIVHGQWTVGERDAIIAATAEQDNRDYGYCGVRIFVEQEPGPIWEEEPIAMADGTQKKLSEVTVGDRVINLDGKATDVVAVHIQGQRQSLKITTESGRVVHAAKDHPFLTPIGWVNADDLRVGDALALRSGSKSEPTSQPTLEECRLAGYFVGDGCCTFVKRKAVRSATSIVCSDPKQGEDLIHCGRSLGMSVKVGGSKGWTYFYANGSRDWLWERGLAGKSTETKVVPEWVFSANDDCVAHFIGAYFACDGCVSFASKSSSVSVEFYSVNKALLEQVQSLLLRFGVFCKLRQRFYRKEFQARRRLTYRLIVPKSGPDGSDYAAKFAERIPVFGKKRELLAKLRRSDFDRPYIRDTIVSIEEIGMLPCRCLTVADGSSFLVRDIVVHNSGGKESAENSIKMLAGNIVGKEKVTGKKYVRAEPFASQCEALNVFICTDRDRIKPWIADFLDELCVVEGTRIVTMRGCVPVEDVLIGDFVFGRGGWTRVIHSFMSHPDARVCRILTRSGASLTLTPNHPILVQGCDFIPAGLVRVGQRLLRYIGEKHTPSILNQGADFVPDAVACSVVMLPERRPVFNLTVEGVPEYIANGLVVHNCQFPTGTYSDQVDACSGALNQLIKGSYAAPAVGGGGQGSSPSSGAGGSMGSPIHHGQIGASGPSGSLRNFRPL